MQISSPAFSDVVVEFEKRPRAVMVADIVGYTRLMEAAEFETHARWRRVRVEVCDPIIVSHRGELVKNTGDGFIAIFEVPSDALRCAAELQREMAQHQASSIPERRIALRVGLHWEPVIIDNNDVYGGGVNIAVRLQSAAPAGGVVASAALVEALDDFGKEGLDDLGELHLKNLVATGPCLCASPAGRRARRRRQRCERVGGCGPAALDCRYAFRRSVG